MLPKVLKVDRGKEVILERGGVEFTVRLNANNKPYIALEMVYARMYDHQRVNNHVRSEVLRRAAAILKRSYRPPAAPQPPRQLQLLFPHKKGRS